MLMEPMATTTELSDQKDEEADNRGLRYLNKTRADTILSVAEP